jgi:hypothetical protein
MPPLRIPLLLWPLFVLLTVCGPAALCADASRGDVDGLYKEATDAYAQGRYAQANMSFQKIIDDHQFISADLCYNIGCTEAKLSAPGRAALWFYRCLAMNPRHKEARQNLRFLSKAQGATGFSREGIDALLQWMKVSTWQWIFWTSFWLTVLGAAWLVFVRLRPRWPAVVAVCIGGTVAAASAAGLVLRRQQLQPAQISVAVEDGLFALTAPAESADQVIAVNAGTQVRPLESRGRWTYVELPGDTATRGWMKSDSLQPLWPFPESLTF